MGKFLPLPYRENFHWGIGRRWRLVVLVGRRKVGASESLRVNEGMFLSQLTGGNSENFCPYPKGRYRTLGENL